MGDMKPDSIYTNRHFFGRILTVALFSVLSVAGIIFSIYLLAIANYLWLQIVALSFTILSLIAGTFNFYACILYYRSYVYTEHLAEIRKKLTPLTKFPSVAIAIPIYNEDPKMVEENLMSLKKMDYPSDRMKFYFIDDSTDAAIVKKLAAVAKRHGVSFIHRDNRQGFKAGAINNMLKRSKEEYVAIFDCDETLYDTQYLKEVLPYFSYGNVSYVQTEKRYKRDNFFSNSVDLFDGFFFNFIQPARALNNTAIFAGSCGVISRKALDDIGGFPEYVIEDTFFSFESDEHNYNSLYIPKVYARGRPVRTFTELAKMQWRYNYGDTQFISYFFKRKGFRARTPLSNMDYITHGFGLNYLSVVLIMFTLASIGVVFSAVPLAHIDVGTFFSQNNLSIDLELLGFFAFTLSLLTPVLLTKIYFGSLSEGFMVFLLNYALAFVRAKAAIATILKKNPGMHWNRLNISKEAQAVKTVFLALSNTKTEAIFATGMFVLAAFAIMEQNLAGMIWLIWYGILYSLPTIFLHRYG